MLATAATAAAGCLLLAPAVATGAKAPLIAERQEIVTLLGPHVVYATPEIRARSVGQVAGRRPITRARTALPVLERVADRRGFSFLRVRLPGRALRGKRLPRRGWIRSSRTVGAATAWHIVVHVRLRRVAVFREGHWVASFRAIVGKAATPTPRGVFFVEENVRLAGSHSGAPFALATSARSDVLQEFDGGPGQIALHGRANLVGRPGTAVSHGCVRLSGRHIRWLAARIRPGVPVTIV